MTKFFTKEDFKEWEQWVGQLSLRLNEESLEKIAVIANTKLEKESRIVYSTKVMADRDTSQWFTEPQIDKIHGVNWSTHKALLVNIESIETISLQPESLKT